MGKERSFTGIAVGKILLLCLSVSARTYAQREFTYSINNAPLNIALDKLHQVTDIGYRISSDYNWDDSLYNSSLRITIPKIKAPPEVLFALILNTSAFKPGYSPGMYYLVPKNITGRILDIKGGPMAGIVIRNSSSQNTCTSNNDGFFSMESDAPHDMLIFYGLNIEPYSKQISGRIPNLVITLKYKTSNLDTVYNGYHKISNDKVAGSFGLISNALLTRSASPDILDRLPSLTPGLLVNPVAGAYKNELRIRGESTLNADPRPLIILDNFPYEGDIRAINPNDVDMVTILKDATAASIWGVRAGNGVIVITTKTGKFRQPLTLNFNTQTTVLPSPRITRQPAIRTGDYISLQQSLFAQGFYNDWEADPQQRILSPVVETLIQQREGSITGAEAAKQLDKLRQQDTRRDMEKYLYRSAVLQQYSVGINGGDRLYKYYLSAGYDNNPSNLLNNGYKRVTVNTNHYLSVSKSIKLTMAVLYTNSQWVTTDTPVIHYPYEQLADMAGNPLPVESDYRMPFKDSAERAGLLNWQYRPLEELLQQRYVARERNIRIDGGVSWQISKPFQLRALFEYQKSSNNQFIFHEPGSYFVRNAINRFSQLSGGGIVSAVPEGGIRENARSELEARNLRVQFEYNKAWNNYKHEINIMAGVERRSIITDTVTWKEYGVNTNRQQPVPVRSDTAYPLFVNPLFTEYIGPPDMHEWAIDNLQSVYFNGVYNYDNRYLVTLSLRKDANNYFGDVANRRHPPLYSAGFLWNSSQENFYTIKWLPLLRLKATFGYSGNLDRSVSTRTTISGNSVNVYGQPAASINDAGNNRLRWEKTGMLNLAVEMATRKDLVHFTLEYFSKNSKDLYWNSPIDNTTGIQLFTGNTAGMKGDGMEMTLSVNPVQQKKINWESTLRFSYVHNKVKPNRNPLLPIWMYCDPFLNIPLGGNAPYSVYSLPTAPLDPLTGDPQTRVNGQPGKNYTDVVLSTDPSLLINHGSKTPRFYGSLFNDFRIDRWNINFLLSFKLGYYFRRSSIDYDALLTGNSFGHPDYYDRWQSPGDESHTTIPSLVYSLDEYRSMFYRYSESLVERGDHIRFQDLWIGYDLRKKENKRGLHQPQLYMYINNLGIIWRANNKGIDPDFQYTIPSRTSYSLGLKFQFN